MSAQKGIKKLGIVAGGGALPGILARACTAQGIEPLIIGFQGITPSALYRDHKHICVRLGQTGRILRALRAQGIEDIVLIGAIRRPQLWEILPDWTTIRFFLFSGGVVAGGDHDFLSRLRRFIEGYGLRIHGIHAFVQDLLMPVGAQTHCTPDEAAQADIDFGFRQARNIGAQDIGQSVIVKNGAVLGIEDKSGTDALIERCGAAGAVLVKACKPHQDKDLDLPTIGPGTVEKAVAAGLAGIAVQAGAALFVEPQRVAQIADQHKLFVVGITTSKKT